MKQVYRLQVSLVVVMLCTVFCIAAGGCGQPFKPVEDIPAGKGVLYVYRPWELAGSALSYVVVADGTVLGEARNGSYLSRLVDAGEVELMARMRTTTILAVDVKKGQETYVKAGFKAGPSMIGGPDAALTIMPPNQAREQIKSCKLK